MGATAEGFLIMRNRFPVEMTRLATTPEGLGSLGNHSEILDDS